MAHMSDEAAPAPPPGHSDRPTASELVAQDYIGHDPTQAGPIRGREGFKQVVGMYQAAFEDALSERVCQMFTLLGPAGVGKSRLTEEFLRRAADQACQIHRGYCESYLSAEPLQPFLQMLRGMDGLHAVPAVGDPAWASLRGAADAAANLLQKQAQCEIDIKGLVSLTALDEPALRARLADDVERRVPREPLRSIDDRVHAHEVEGLVDEPGALAVYLV